jgi:hypothetical protein
MYRRGSLMLRRLISAFAIRMASSSVSAQHPESKAMNVIASIRHSRLSI